MTLSREADQLLPPRMTPFTGLFQRPQCDPEPTTFPVHSQSPSDTPSLKGPSCLPRPHLAEHPRADAGALGNFSRTEAAPGSTSLLCQLWGSARNMAEVWKVMENPKNQGSAGPTGADPLNPKCAARNSSEKWCSSNVLGKNGRK